MGAIDRVKDFLGIYDDITDFYDELSKMQAWREKFLATISRQSKDMLQWIEDFRSVEDLKYFTSYIKEVTGTSKSIRQSIIDSISKLTRLRIKAQRVDLHGVIPRIDETKRSLEKLLAENEKLISSIDAALRAHRRVSTRDSINMIVRIIAPALVSVTSTAIAATLLNRKVEMVPPDLDTDRS